MKNTTAANAVRVPGDYPAAVQVRPVIVGGNNTRREVAAE